MPEPGLDIGIDIFSYQAFNNIISYIALPYITGESGMGGETNP